jgi:hypothetical protein
VPTSEEIVARLIYHQVVAELYPTAKRLIYRKASAFELSLLRFSLQRLPEVVIEAEDQLAQLKCTGEGCRDVGMNLKKLWSFEVSRYIIDLCIPRKVQILK